MTDWEESEHPRRPDGEFREKVGGRWAQRFSDQISPPAMRPAPKGKQDVFRHG